MPGFDNSSFPNLNPNLNITSLKPVQVDFSQMYVLSFYILFGPPTHIYVLWLIVTGKGIASEFLNVNISVCEMINCVNLFIIILATRFPGINLFNAFTTGFYITGRVLFQCLMCVERYLAVLHPVTFLKYKPLRYRVICSAAVWFMTISSCWFCLFTVIDHISVYMCCVLLQFLLLLSVNLLCCLSVLWALKKPGPGEIGKEKEENHMKRRAFYLILITTVSMFTMFVPVIIQVFFFFLLIPEIPIFTYSSLLCYNLVGFVQPVLYLYRTGKLSFLCCS